MKKYFFLGGLDLEMVEIKKILEAEGINFEDKNLGWGAKASAYSEEIIDAVNDGFTPVLVELELDVELPKGIVVIDHHGQRASEPPSIKQVLDLLGLEADRWQKLVGANDAGYIPAMLVIGATEEEVAQIRAADRSAQGITPEQEDEAERAISSAEKIGSLVVIRMSHSKCATVSDRLFGTWPDGRENLLVLSEDGEVNFFGNGALCTDLKEKFEGWNGGSGLGDSEGIAFWGGYPNHNDVLNFVVEKVK